MAKLVHVFMELAFFFYLCIWKVAGDNSKKHTIVTLPKTMKRYRLFVKLQSCNGVPVASTAVLPSSAGLALLISITSNLRTETTSHQHVLSFGTDQLTNNIVKEVLEAGHNNTFMQFERERCHMVSIAST